MSTQEFNFNINRPFDEEITYKTLITSFEDGKEQRRQKWSSPKRTFTVTLSAKSKTIEDRVWSFYKDRAGAYDTFYFTNPNESPVTENSTTADTGAGDITTFAFPNSPWPSGDVIVYKDSAASGTEGVDWTVNRVNGTVTFAGGYAPEAGTVISAKYPFSYVVRFLDDNLSRELFSYRLWNNKLKLLQVL